MSPILGAAQFTFHCAAFHPSQTGLPGPRRRSAAGEIFASVVGVAGEKDFFGLTVVIDRNINPLPALDILEQLIVFRAGSSCKPSLAASGSSTCSLAISCQGSASAKRESMAAPITNI